MDNQNVAVPWILERHARVGGVTEVRAFRRTASGERSVYSGLFTPELADALLAALRPTGTRPRRRIPPNDHPRDGEASFHFSLNAVARPSTLKQWMTERRWGRLERVRTTVRDKDIVATSLFLIDVDPGRPSNTSATDNEKELALEVAERIAAWLSEKNVSVIRADSGNGYHLLVPLVPFRGDEISRAARDGQDLLKVLDERFSRPGIVKADIGNFNPSRLTKLYGTRAVKGAHSKERPHRYSGIDLSSIPADIDLFSVVRDDIDEYRYRTGRGARGLLWGGPRRVPGGGGAACGGPSGDVPAVRSGAGSTVAGGSLTGDGSPDGPMPGDSVAMERSQGNVSRTASSGLLQNRRDPFAWRQWRTDALDVTSLETLYGDLLTGRARNDGWLECRDPSSSTGDRNPSAGVADGTGSAERGTFHSFISGETLSAFDFIVAQGIAADFRTACAWVADHSGVPLPGRVQDVPGSLRSEGLHEGLHEDGLPRQDQARQEEDIFDLDQIDTFLKAFRGEEDRKRKPELLRSFLERLVQAPALEQHIALEELHRNTGFPLPALKRTLADLQRDEIVDELEDPPDGIPVLEVVRGQEAIASLFTRLIRFLLPLERFYSRQAGLLFLQRSMPPLPVTEGNLSGLLAGLVEFRAFQRVGGRRQVIGYEPLSPTLCRAFVNSPKAREQLPPLAVYSQAPFFASDWTFIARAGYYRPDGGIYYDGPTITPKPHCTEALDALTRGSFWRDPADRVNFLGALLTGLTSALWVNGHGVIVINGNRTGIGKGILAQAIALVTDGRKARSLTFELDQTEFEKQLGMQVDQGGRVIFIDNIKVRRPVESAVLERTVTDWVPNFRRLGTNSPITRDQNDLLFCLTMNDALLGADMRRRALPINLHVEGPAIKRPGAVPDPKLWLLKHWLELVAELAGMVQVWLEAGRPMAGATASHTTSETWALTIDAILRANGHEGFLSNYDASMGAFDQDYQLMMQICRAHQGLAPQTASDWAAVLRTGLLEDRFKDRSGQFRSAHAQTQVVGRLVAGYRDVVMTVDGSQYYLVRTEPDGSTHSPLFHFEKVEM